MLLFLWGRKVQLRKHYGELLLVVRHKFLGTGHGQLQVLLNVRARSALTKYRLANGYADGRM